MHLISFDASPRQLSKLRNGHKVRIKKGTGFNLVVHPENYKLVSRSFVKNKGVELKLSPEELDVNKTLSPEQHEELGASMEGNGIHKYIPFSSVGGSIFKRFKKAMNSKTAKRIGREMKPFTRALKRTAQDVAHEKIAQAHMEGANRYGGDPRYAHLMNVGADVAHQHVEGYGLMNYSGPPRNPYPSPAEKGGIIGKGPAPKPYYIPPNYPTVGAGLGCGLGAGMNAHDALRMANLATANANHQFAKMHNATVHGQLTQPPVKRYWNDSLAPPSRGTGMHNHYNMIRGRGSLLDDNSLPPALQSQPYGANFHMQFMLPPQYHKYNDGTDIEGRGLYI